MGRAVAIAFVREGGEASIKNLPEEEPGACEVTELTRADGRKAMSIPGGRRLGSNPLNSAPSMSNWRWRMRVSRLAKFVAPPEQAGSRSGGRLTRPPPDLIGRADDSARPLRA